MRRFIRVLCLGLLLAGLSCAPSGQPPANQQAAVKETEEDVGPIGPVEMTPIKLNELSEKIAQFKGKVVVVDFWASWCGPCRIAFPHLVQMHRKYEKDGLVAVSVNLDDPSSKEAQEESLQFLRQKHADFLNLALAPGEDSQTWWNAIIKRGIPFIRVYGRDGQLADSFTGRDEYPRVDKLVTELLKN